MGRDKAGVVIDGQPLWRRQLSTLRAVAPQELFISGRVDGPYAGHDIEVIFDAAAGLGPLAGLAAALHRARHSFLLVLAIDLPAMTPDFLRRLIAASAATGKGIVPRLDDHFEPLTAIYPRDCLPLVEQALQSDDRSLQRVLREARRAALVAEYHVAPGDHALFKNLNSPGDLPA